MGTVLRLLDDHGAAEELDAVGRPQDLGFDQPIVFEPRISDDRPA
jgi:hypothetical protein